MKITNGEAYSYAKGLVEIISNENLLIPAKVNYIIQKNNEKIQSIANLVEKSRENLIRTHGELTEDGTQYIVPKEKTELVNNELVELLEIENEVNILQIHFDDLEKLGELSLAAMQSLMFMIKEEEC